jgi:hypothetical protein
MAEPTAPATGAPAPTPTPTPPAAPDPQGDPAALGDAGKRALDAERQARKQAEDRIKELEPLATRAREIEESQKTEQQKLADKLAAAEAAGTTSTSELLRLDVALDKAPPGMEPAKIRKLAKRLTGTTREELEADAAELFAEFGGAPAKPTPGQRPTENLPTVPVPGAGNESLTDMNDWMRRKSSSS